MCCIRFVKFNSTDYHRSLGQYYQGSMPYSSKEGRCPIDHFVEVISISRDRRVSGNQGTHWFIKYITMKRTRNHRHFFLDIKRVFRALSTDLVRRLIENENIACTIRSVQSPPDCALDDLRAKYLPRVNCSWVLSCSIHVVKMFNLTVSKTCCKNFFCTSCCC